MTSSANKKPKYQIRARLPLIMRGLAIAAMFVTILVIGIGFYWGSFRSSFVMKGFPTKLSDKVVGEVNGYERRESENGVAKYFIKADRAVTFSDDHQELENVYLEVFQDGNESISDKISSEKAVYVPADDGTKNFKIFFADDVNIETHDSLKVKTELLTYNKATEIAEAEEYVEFSRENIAGKSYGARVNIANKSLDLQKDVRITAFSNGSADDELTKAKVESARINADSAFIDQIGEKIRLDGNVAISLVPDPNADGNLKKPADIKSDRATALFSDKEIRQIDLSGKVFVHQKPTAGDAGWTKLEAGRAVATVNVQLEKLELFENVRIESKPNDSEPTNIRSNTAVYYKRAETYELKDKVEILTVQDSKKTRITSASAVYQENNGKVFLNGNAAVEQGPDLIRGDVIKADLYADRKIKYAEAYRNAFLRQKTSERTTEISAAELNAAFGQGSEIRDAKALGNVEAVVIPVRSADYNRFSLFAPKWIDLDFRNDGSLSNFRTQGRTTIKLNAPNNSPDAADKTLTADAVNTTFRGSGNELATVQAIGNAELLVSPLRASASNFKTMVNAPRFDCEFFPGNNARSCTSTGDSKVVRSPTSGGRTKQTLTAGKLSANFRRDTQDVESFDATGGAKFTEGDRNGTADRIAYSANDATVRLRGGDPTVWDSQARGKAQEIDWDTKNSRSSLRGKTAVTYYSQKQSGGTPFTKVNAPVFLTSNEAHFDHNLQTGLFTGNARAWQDNNYVRADKLFLEEKKGRFYAEGSVQSLLYDVNQTVAGRRSKTPVYASSQQMVYQKDSNLIRYEKDVDIRQGNDRISVGTAIIYLDKENELLKTVMEGNVVITQPGRRASGDFAEYSATAETVVLRGNPARVSDSESGSSEGREVTVFLAENRVVGGTQDPKNNTGRSRTVYKIKPGKLN
ncbi:MAG: LPS export ABC transporter periplasmic protein LptC [Pyrinomonadaceae bacterium]